MAPALSKQAAGPSAPATPPSKKMKLSERNLNTESWPKTARLFLVQTRDRNTTGSSLKFCGKDFANGEEMSDEALVYGIPSWGLGNLICVEIARVAAHITGSPKSVVAQITAPAAVVMGLKIRRPRHLQTGTCSIHISLTDVRMQRCIKDALNNFCAAMGISLHGDYGGDLFNASRVNMQWGLIRSDPDGTQTYCCVVTGEPGTFGTRTYGDILSSVGARFYKDDESMPAHWRVKEKYNVLHLREKLTTAGCLLSDVEIDEDAQQAWDNAEELPVTAAPASPEE
jgi:hypothetical protein